MLKLKLQYFGHQMQRPDSLEKTLMLERLKAEGEGDDRGWDGQMASLTRWTWIWASSGSWWWTGRPRVLQSMRFQRVVHNWVTELNWMLENGTYYQEWSWKLRRGKTGIFQDTIYSRIASMQVFKNYRHTLLYHSLRCLFLYVTGRIHTKCMKELILGRHKWK